MADILCPKCNHPNPKEAETCQFCGAHLVPAPGAQPDFGNSQPQGKFSENNGTNDDEGYDLPDWLKNWGEEKDSTPSKPTQSVEKPPAIESAETKDDLEAQSQPAEEEPWLARIRERSRQDREQGTTGTSDLPGWLTSEDQAGASEESSHDEDWLKDFETDSKQGAESPGKSPSTEGLPELPSWLKELSEDQGEFSQDPGVKPPGQDTFPDWLTGVNAAELAGTSAGPSQPFGDTSGIVSDEETELSQFDQEENPPAEPAEIPDWLTDLAPEGQIPERSSQEPPPLVFTEEEPAQTSYEKVQPFSSEELPEWLARMSSPEEGLVEEKPEIPAGKEGEEEIVLAPAELPSWVQAMRPIESATPEVSELKEEERVQSAGPLAGLRGILPTTETVGSEVRKPAVYAVNLQVSEKQRINAALFETMLSSERQPQAAPRTRALSSQQILRIVLAVVLVIAAFVPIWLNSQRMSLPGILPVEANQLLNTINGLPENSTVLVAVDFEPAFSGEVNAAASSVIAHLMSKSANLVLVSTNPVGPVLGEQLLTLAQANEPAYSISDKTINLGYLAGGPSGLFNFALQPRLATPLTVNQEWAWSQPSLENIESLSDFAGVLVITDNADTARNWVEQVQPFLSGVPLLMVTSAQAAPLVRPYYDAGQVQGYVSGMTGGAIYEDSSRAYGISTFYWDSYQVGIIVAVVIIALGGLIAVGDVAFSRRRFGEENKS